MRWIGRTLGATALVLAAAAGLGRAAERGTSAYTVRVSTFLGGTGDDDSVVGVGIQPDGAIVLAANLAPDAAEGLAVGRTTGDGSLAGSVLRLSADGGRILSLTRLAAAVHDLSLDASGGIYLAAADDGALKLAADASRVLWRQDLGGACTRIDGAVDGHAVALVGRRGAVVLDPAGEVLAEIGGRGHHDVCIDGATRTVVVTGFRNARTWDRKMTNPVQISHLRGHAYDGKLKWNNYDWSTDRNSDRWINRPTNNMADTRGYRCEIGRDGKLYAAFEAAGGNHIFRYSPKDISGPANVIGGGPYHLFYGGGGAAHRTVWGRFDPATGELDRIQQLTGRTDAGRCTNVRMKQSAIAVDRDGRIVVAGWAGPSLPIDLDPCPAGTAKGGPFLLAMTPDFRGRLVCTRMQEPGWVHAADVRRPGGKVTIVYGGSGAEAGMHLVRPLQKTPRGKDAFLVILEGPADAGPTYTAPPPKRK